MGKIPEYLYYGDGSERVSLSPKQIVAAIGAFVIVLAITFTSGGNKKGPERTVPFHQHPDNNSITLDVRPIQTNESIKPLKELAPSKYNKSIRNRP